MAKLKIVDRETQYAVQFDDGFVFCANDQEEAEATVRLTDGKLLARDWLISEWYEPEVAK